MENNKIVENLSKLDLTNDQELNDDNNIETKIGKYKLNLYYFYI